MALILGQVGKPNEFIAISFIYGMATVFVNEILQYYKKNLITMENMLTLTISNLTCVTASMLTKLVITACFPNKKSCTASGTLLCVTSWLFRLCSDVPGSESLKEK